MQLVLESSNWAQYKAPDVHPLSILSESEQSIPINSVNILTAVTKIKVLFLPCGVRARHFHPDANTGARLNTAYISTT